MKYVHKNISHIRYIFEAAVRKYPRDENMWLQYAEYLAKDGSSKSVSKVLGRALQLNPNAEKVWLTAASQLYFAER